MLFTHFSINLTGAMNVPMSNRKFLECTLRFLVTEFGPMKHDHSKTSISYFAFISHRSTLSHELSVKGTTFYAMPPTDAAICLDIVLGEDTVHAESLLQAVGHHSLRYLPGNAGG